MSTWDVGIGRTIIEENPVANTRDDATQKFPRFGDNVGWAILVVGTGWTYAWTS